MQTEAREEVRICGTFAKPSDGLEPSTPSLPWRFRGGTGGHRRALAITFLLQIVPSRRVSRARACPLVRGLMYPSRTRGVLSVLETDDAAGCRARRRVSFGLRIAYVPPAEPSNAGLCGCRSRAGHKSRGTVIYGHYWRGATLGQRPPARGAHVLGAVRRLLRAARGLRCLPSFAAGCRAVGRSRLTF
jgi:hypothetical protein